MPISGTTTVTAPIAPSDLTDIYATHEDVFGKGGYMVVVNTTERDAIPVARRKEGMIVFSITGAATYRLNSDLTSWTSLVFSSGSTGVATDPIWDTKGDLAVATGANAAIKLAAGTDTYVLTADSSTATGLKWAAPSGGSGSGDVVGPAGATDNAVARYDGTTGKLLQNSAVTIADTSGDITAGKYNTVAVSGTSTPNLTVNGTAVVSGTNTGDQTSVTGNAGTVTVADAGGDTTTWVMLATAQTGSLAPATDAGLTYNANTNVLTAGKYNNVAITAPATGSTLTIVDGATLTVSASATITNGTHSGTNTGDQTDITGNAATLTLADGNAFTNTFMVFSQSATGNHGLYTDTALVYNPTSNTLFVEHIELGPGGAVTGTIKLGGSTSGNVTLSVAAAAGTHTIKLPTADGTTDQVLKTNGSGQWGWTTVAGGGNVSNTGTPTSGQAAEWTSATVIQGVAVSGTGDYVKNDGAFIDNAALTNPKTDLLDFEGSTSGFVTVTVPAIAGTHTVKLPTADGSANQVLKTDGSGQWGWVTPSTAGTKTIAIFAPADNEPPSSNYATLLYRNNHPSLAFDTTTQETAIFRGRIPEGSVMTSGVTVYLQWAATSATSGTIGWDVAFERLVDAGQDLDSDNFGTAQTVTAATVSGTSGITLVTSVNFSQAQLPTSLDDGDMYRIRIRRDVTNDTATGDAELYQVEVRLQ